MPETVEYTALVGDEETAFEENVDEYSYYISSYHIFWLPLKERERLALSLFIAVIFVILIGLLANAVLIYALVAFGHVRRRIHYVLVVNLAVVNELFMLSWGVENVEWEAEIAFTGSFTWNQAKYSAGLVARVTVMTAMAITITALTVDQYLVIRQPAFALKWRSKKGALIICCIIWAGGLLIGISLGLKTAVSEEASDYFAITIFQFVALYVCPFAVIVFCQMSVRRKWASRHTPEPRVDASSSPNRRPPPRVRNGSPRIQMHLFSLSSPVTVAFVFGWGLYHLTEMAAAFVALVFGWNHAFYEDSYYLIMERASLVLLCVLVSLNPFLYIGANPRVRSNIYGCLMRRKRGNAAVINDVTARRDREASSSTVTLLVEDTATVLEEVGGTVRPPPVDEESAHAMTGS